MTDARGTITRKPDPPGIELAAWERVIAAHPSLKPATPATGRNPFTDAKLEFRPHPGTASVVVGGRKIGVMSWAEDGGNEIVVWSDDGSVDEVALQVASELGASYAHVEIKS